MPHRELVRKRVARNLDTALMRVACSFFQAKMSCRKL